MLFRRKGALVNVSILLTLLVSTHGQSQSPTQSNSRSYDTNDWIPVSRPAAPGEGSQQEAAQKRPTGRVLNLPSQDEKRFFAVEQQTAANPQQYRLPPDAAKHQQPQLLQNQRQFQPQPTYVPNGQQQILLPPQLQSLISQGQAYISPQNINQQLLQTPTQGYSTVPTQNFQLNASDFNTKEIIQNINLGLYNQQPVKQQVHQSQQIQQQQPQQVKLQHDNEQPEIQLLYVPLENLQRQRGQRQQVVFPTEQAVAAPQIYNPPPQQQYQSPVQHKQVQLQNIEQDFVQQALQAQKLQEQFQHNVQPVPQQSYRRPFPEVLSQPQTTPAPKKRKPHQPPLAVYMGTEGQEDIKIGDVLSILKDAKSISVQDTVGPDSPQVFVGPSHLEPPDGYMKFDLPYLSSIENNRVERKVDQLPFFVAPLSYKAPPGYSKIPFPAPHVGSVVINHLKATPSTTTEYSRYIHPQTLEDTSSHIPFSQPEVSTIRSTRGRQRQPSRNSFTASTVQTPVSAEIPYGPLPTRVSPEVQQPHSVQESLISPNPYGPTRFVQSTTPAIYEKPVSLPEEIFSTKNRFLTTSPAYNTHNIQSTPTRQSQYSHRHEASPTEPTLSSSTLSTNLINDKYTVLEQFPIGGKQIVQQTEESIPHRIPNRQHSRRPTQEPYHQESSEKTALPLISSTHFSNQNEFESQTPYRQQFVQQETPRQRLHNYEEIPTKQTYQETTKQRVPETYQEEPTKQRVTETYQEIPTRQRITENYQAAPHTTQSSSVQQILLKEQIPTQQSHQDYELPVRHVTQQSQIRGQHQFVSQNYDRDLPLNHNTQFTSQAQTQRTRGKQHFTPGTYFQEDYDQHINEKTTEPLITVTKEPVVEYKIPEEQTHHVSDNRGQQHHQQLIQDTYYQDEPQLDTIPSKQEYTLPAKLPPISPQLPGLINSLQDQQIRPLLAPLLLPPSEQPPVEESSHESQEEYYSSPEPVPVHVPVPTTTTTTTTTTTPAPITETTTQFKRIRGRQRVTRPTAAYDYVSTTAAPRRPTQYRGRRPYNGQPRQEYKPRENYPVSSTTHSDVITESTTRAVYNRNRHAPQRQYVSSTTEQPRRSPSPLPSRQRFRTRGRPTKTEEEYIERSTPENVPVFKQPVLEGGFQAASPVLQQNVQLTVPSTHITDHEGNVRDEPAVSQRSQKEQALIYIQNTNKPILQEASPVPDVYIPRQQFISSTEALEPLHHSTIAATGPESNFVPDVVHDQPTLLSTQQHVKYNNPTETNLNSQEDYSSKEEINSQVPQIKYNLQPEIKEQSTTEFTRTRSRTRVKTRGRINPSVSTARYQPSYSTSTTHRTTTEAKQEGEEEFYGFFRQPNFGKATQTEKPRTEYVLSSPSPSPRPNVAYLSRSTEQPQQQRFYVSSENNPINSSPKPYLPVTHIEDSYVEPNIQVQRQYISSTVAPSVSSSEESVVDIKPVTRRPAIRTRRPITSHVRTAEISSAVPEQSNEKYHVRPTRRPEIQTTRPTRIRGRIRKPTHATTAQSAEIQNSYSHSPRTNELDNNNSEEFVTPAKTRQRLTTSRGKSHFQGPRNEKVSEPEEENYPASFLQGHGIQQSSPSSIISYSTPAASTPQPVILTTPGPVTARPAFQLTIEPEDAEEEYLDQVPYSSVNQPSVANKDLEEGLEESKFSAKFIEKPSNFNYIISNDKPSSTTEKYVETTTTTENSITEETRDTVPQLTTSKTAEETVQPSEITTTDLPATTTESLTEKPKGRRRGVWRLVNSRPVGDDFESAESQNIQSVFSDNEFASPEKPIRKYKIVQRIRTSTEPLQYESTTQNIPETTFRPQNEITTQKFEESSTSENNIFGPLYEMFGYNSEQHLNEENLEINENNDATTTENPTMFNTAIDEVELTTLVNNNSTEIPDKVMTYSDIMQNEKESSVSDEEWHSRIIGTSTTTEVSHETEICYRGRCIKSASTEENSEERL